MKSTTNLQGVTPRSGRLNWSNGSHAPMYVKQAQFNSRSMTEEKFVFSVCALKCPSQLIAVPRKTGVSEAVDLMETPPTRGKGGKQVVATKSADNTDGKQRERYVLRHVCFAVNVSLAVEYLHEPTE